MSIDWWPCLFAALCTAILMPIAMRARSIGRDGDFRSVQKVHVIPASRLGGGVLFLAYLATLAWATPMDHAVAWPAVVLAICCVPVMLIGLWEDVTGSVRPWYRLAAAVASAALASVLAGGTIARLDLPVLDGWLRYSIFALPLTWFMVAGACNAINLIDGAHGLAAGTALMMFAGLAAMAGHVGDRIVMIQALTMVGAIVGFLVWNYPLGKVFLGDAGAYLLGFMYAELSIQIVSRNAGVSAWYVIALAAYPIVETLYTIYRRKLVQRTASMQPDAAHLHSLIFRRLATQSGRERRGGGLNRVNASVAPRLWLHGALCLVAALLLHENTRALIGFSAIYGACYIVFYRVQARVRAERPRHTLRRAEES